MDNQTLPPEQNEPSVVKYHAPYWTFALFGSVLHGPYYAMGAGGELLKITYGPNGAKAEDMNAIKGVQS